MVIDAAYNSIWDSGRTIITTNCKWDTEKRVAFDVDMSDDLIDEDGEEVESLDAEYVELPDGERIFVDYEQEKDGFIPAFLLTAKVYVNFDLEVEGNSEKEIYTKALALFKDNLEKIGVNALTIDEYLEV